MPLSDKHKQIRKNLRLPDFDYSNNGAYYVTIVTQNRACLFGQIYDNQMVVNGAGKMIDEVCKELPMLFASIQINPYQIMPNHIHAILVIEYDQHVGADLRVCPNDGQTPIPKISLSTVVQRFKSLTTCRYIDGVNTSGWTRFDKRLWQRNYYEHVIRNEQDYKAISAYIKSNPENWEKDREFTSR